MSSARKPDYVVGALLKDTMLKKADCKGDIGAAWVNSDGTISVVLNPFVSLQQDGDLLITLFPKLKQP